MRSLKTIDEMRAVSRAAREQGRRRRGLVPTMGALHAGHLSLVRAARAQCDWVAASVFVNPLQFAPNEDFARYPRQLERDRQILEAEGVDVLFAPSAEEMYPPGRVTMIEVPGLSERLCGASRPGHFCGVATVVAKLFHIVEPDIAFFGQKDAVQVAIIRRMVRDLDLPLEIIIGPIVREPDGLALSSRNAYLDPQQRKAAPVLHRALMRTQLLADRGETSVPKLIEAARSVLAEEPAVRVDYVEIVNPETLEPVTQVAGGLVAVAGYLGSTRLIDNLLLTGSGTAQGPAT